MLQATARQLGYRSQRRAVSATGQRVNLQGVRGERGTPAQRADQRPGMAPVNGEILTGSQRDPMRRIRQWGVIEVLADVVLVEAHGSVRRQRQILRVGQI